MIHAMPPMVTQFGSCACLKLTLNGHEISVSCDDSCGALDTLRRVDVRVFRDDEDVTDEFGGAPDDGWTAEALMALMLSVVTHRAGAST